MLSTQGKGIIAGLAINREPSRLKKRRSPLNTYSSRPFMPRSRAQKRRLNSQCAGWSIPDCSLSAPDEMVLIHSTSQIS